MDYVEEMQRMVNLDGAGLGSGDEVVLMTELRVCVEAV